MPDLCATASAVHTKTRRIAWANGWPGVLVDSYQSSPCMLGMCACFAWAIANLTSLHICPIIFGQTFLSSYSWAAYSLVGCFGTYVPYSYHLKRAIMQALQKQNKTKQTNKQTKRIGMSYFSVPSYRHSKGELSGYTGISDQHILYNCLLLSA